MNNCLLLVVVLFAGVLVKADVDDCAYFEYSGVAIGMNDCFCSYDEYDGYECTYWGCAGTDSDDFQFMQWDGTSCFSGNPTLNYTLSASVYGDDANANCPNGATNACNVIIRSYDSTTDATDCDSSVDYYSEAALVSGYCYAFSSFSAIIDCDGVYTYYTESSDCTGSSLTLDSTGSCDCEDGYGCEYVELVSSCDSSGSSSSSSGSGSGSGAAGIKVERASLCLLSLLVFYFW